MEYYPRIIEQKIEPWIKRKKAILIKGPRQAGKTTLFLHLKEKFKGEYVSLEKEDVLKTFEESPELFVKRFKSKYLFIDEAQYSKKTGRIIKLIHDTYPEIKLFVTGSGSFDIKVLISKYLVGRAISFELLPLNFEEFIMWKAGELTDLFRDFKTQILDFIEGKKRVKLQKAFENEFRSLLHEFLIFGGFPEIVKEEDEKFKKELLENLYRTYLEKDVFFFLNIRHLEKFRGVLKWLAFSLGSTLEISSIMSDLNIDYKTIDNYLTILVNTYILRLLAPFHRNLVTEIKKSKKIYFVDLGLRNAILNNFSPLDARNDKGKLLENFVLNELLFEGFEIKYWRTTAKAEVDFVLIKNGNIIPVEVKSFGKIKRGFLSFLKTYKPKRAVVFTEKEFGVKKIGKTEVLFAPHWMI